MATMSHDSPSRTRAASSYSRRRAGNACLICRSRKTKCDNQRPVCGFCAATGGECRYLDSDPSQFDRASLAILQRMSELETTIINHIDDSFQKHEIASLEGAGIPGRFSHDAPAENIFENHDRRSTADWTPGSAYQRTPQVNVGTSQEAQTDVGGSVVLEDRPPSSNVLLQASEMFADSILKWPIFSQAAPHLEKELHTPIVEFWARSENTQVGQQQSHRKGATMLNLDSDVINELVENFLANNHVKNPILDVESLRNDAREFAETGPQWDERSCLMLLVCAVSSVSASLNDELEPGVSKNSRRLSMAEAYFQASQRRIGMLYHQNSLVVAQCSFLTGVYLMSTMQILAAWKCFVQAGTQCLAWLTSQGRMKSNDSDPDTISSQNLHRVNEHGDPKIAQAEESLYWSCLKSELELRFELGLPGSGINEVEYPHLFPSPPVNFGNSGFDRRSSYESPEMTWSSPKSSISSSDRQNLELGWFFYLAEIALKRIIHNVVSWLYKSKDAYGSGKDFRKSDNYLQTGAVEFEVQIQQWYRTLPPPMKFPTDRDQPTGDILRYILRGHMLDIREVVRFPAIHAILSSHTIFSPDSPSRTCVRLARELLENAVDRIKANQEGFYHRSQGIWLMLRSAARSALHLVGMALKCQQAAAVMDIDRQELEQQVLPSDWKETVEHVIDVLEYWSDESADMKRLSYIFKELMRCYESAGR